MDENKITCMHQGNRTVIHTPVQAESLEKFKQDLLEKGFTIIRDRAFRKSDLLKNDWPIQITFSAQEGFFELTASMYIPLGWLIFHALAVILVPPALWFLLLPMKLGVFLDFALLYLLIMALPLIVLVQRKGARPKQVFDLSPKDSWQHVPRLKWNTIIKNLLENNFEVMVDEIESEPV